MITKIIAPAMETLSRGVVVAHHSIIERKIVGNMYQLVGDMQLREEILGLRNFVAPMQPPLVEINIETISANGQSRSLVAQSRLMEWSLQRLQQRTEVTKARDVLQAAGCNSKGDNITMPALLQSPVFAFWRTFGCSLIPPE